MYNERMGKSASFHSKSKTVALIVKHTLKSERYKVSLSMPPMGLIERYSVKRARARAVVPAWLVEADKSAALGESTTRP
jgi:hypothetical protein